MHKIAAGLTIALLIANVPTGAGQAAPAEIVLATDAIGDVAWSIEGTELQRTDQFPGSDLVGLSIREEADALHWMLQAGALPSSPMDSAELDIFFDHKGQGFAIRVFAFSAVLAPLPPSASLWQFDAAEDEYYRVIALDIEEAGGLYTITTPRDLLRDPSGAPLGPGRTLDGIYATAVGVMDGIINIGDGSEVWHVQQGVYSLYDRLPDDGHADAFEPTLGLAQSGDAFLASDEPMRASNGESGTFYYEVVAGNDGGPQDFVPRAIGVPTGWDVAFQADRIHVADELVPFLVRVTIPFAHQHGAAQTFQVELTGVDDPGDVGRIELGVHFLPIPQPTGHHNTLYFHTTAPSDDTFAVVGDTLATRGPAGFAYMNAVSDDPADSGAPAAGTRSVLSIGFSGFTERWPIPLSPQLRLGIDMDLTRTGEITIPIETVRPMDDAAIRGGLYAVPPGIEVDRFDVEDETIADWIRLASFESEPVAIAAQTTTTFTAIVEPTEQGDYLPYAQGTRLFAIVDLVSSSPGIKFGLERPLIQPGGSMRLPLLEYSDRVADASGFVATTADIEEAAAAFEETPDEVEDAPSVGVAAFVVVAAGAWIRRRR